MTEHEFEASLIEVLKLAGQGCLADGWLYIAPGPINGETPTLFLPSSDDVFDLEELASRKGFPREGLDTVTLEDVVNWTRSNLTATPSDKELVRSFEYYWRFDAFLPALDSDDPPSLEDVLLKLDRDFYAALGEERADTNCRHADCDRGTIAFSVFCRDHHFENIKGRPWEGGSP